MGVSGSAVVLFDIDGTLLRRSGPAHRQALVDAVRRVAGVETTTEHIPVQGMLDRDILSWMLRDAGIAEARIRRLMPDLVHTAQNLYVRRCPDLRARVCPGVRRLLGLLERRQVPLGLVTGNLTRIGWKKMERAGLKPYFSFGAFAELGKTRADLVRLALRHARDRGWLNGNTCVSLIGDHPNDIRAARENGIRAVSVATGLSPVEELSAHSPDVLVNDLKELRLRILLGS